MTKYVAEVMEGGHLIVHARMFFQDRAAMPLQSSIGSVVEASVRELETQGRRVAHPLEPGKVVEYDSLFSWKEDCIHWGWELLGSPAMVEPSPKRQRIEPPIPQQLEERKSSDLLEPQQPSHLETFHQHYPRLIQLPKYRKPSISAHQGGQGAAVMLPSPSWVHRSRGCVAAPGTTPRADWVFGGILAEEMGIGKTLECVALIEAHQRYSHPCRGNLAALQQCHTLGALKLLCPAGDQGAMNDAFIIQSRATLVVRAPSPLFNASRR